MRLPRAQTLDVVCRRDLRAVMDDGAVLLADRWVARAGADRPKPTVLVRSPYGRRQFVGLLFGRLLAERGLQVVIQSVRGTFGSGGTFSPFDERADGLATLRWLREQPWHAGPVGTLGPSYLGFVQWAIAEPSGDELAAMSIHVSASEFHSQTYAGASLSLETLASWLVIVSMQERRLGLLSMDRALRALGAVVAELPLTSLDERLTGAPVAWFQEAFGSPRREDPYWARRDFSREVPAVTTPVQFVGGWYDILLPWMLADYEALQRAGREPALLIGPWAHTSMGLVGAAERDGLAWMRAHLLGDDRLVRASPVRLMITGERTGGGWRDLPSWPPAALDRALYLAEGGALADQPGEADGHLAGAGGAGAGTGAGGPGPSGGDTYRYDPADPTPALGGPVLLSRDPVVDNAPLEGRSDVLTYTGPVLAQTLEAIGHVSVELWVWASAPWFDLFARVCDVDGEGVSRNVSDALASVAPDRFEHSGDGVWHVHFALWPIGHRFAAGHRIRLQVSSGAHPRYARNPGTGEDRAAATAATLRAVDIEVLRDAAHPSRVLLPQMTGP
ncbi:MAG TPA: CocE/NonD family hydrolase [Solirubrobacteraceae bacterium]|nr:CocE/NonD family hydrolase [Solirubrobacteraceae bacterium]